MLQALLDVGGIPIDRKTKDWGRRMIYTLCTWRCAMQKHLTHFFQLFSTMGGPGGKSSAHMAAFFGNLGALQLFLSAGVDVNAKSMYNKQAPLLYGHVELASRPGGGGAYWDGWTESRRAERSVLVANPRYQRHRGLLR